MRLLIRDVPVVDVVPHIKPYFEEVGILARGQQPRSLLLPYASDAGPSRAVDLLQLAFVDLANAIDRACGLVVTVGRCGRGFRARGHERREPRHQPSTHEIPALNHCDLPLSSDS